MVFTIGNIVEVRTVLRRVPPAASAAVAPPAPPASTQRRARRSSARLRPPPVSVPAEPHATLSLTVTAAAAEDGIVCWCPAVVAKRSGRAALIVCMPSSVVVDPALLEASGGAAFEPSQRPARRRSQSSAPPLPPRVVPNRYQSLTCVPTRLVRRVPPASTAFRPLRGSSTTSSARIADLLEMEPDDVALFLEDRNRRGGSANASGGGRFNGDGGAGRSGGSASTFGDDDAMRTGQWVDAWVDSVGVWAEGVMMMRVDAASPSGGSSSASAVDLADGGGGDGRGRGGRSRSRSRSRRSKRSVGSAAASPHAAASTPPVLSTSEHTWHVFFGKDAIAPGGRSSAAGRSVFSARSVRPSVRWCSKLKWWIQKRAGISPISCGSADTRLTVCAVCRLGPLPHRDVVDVGNGLAMHTHCAVRAEKEAETLVRVHLPASMMPLHLRRQRDRFCSCLPVRTEELRLRLQRHRATVAASRNHVGGEEDERSSPFNTRPTARRRMGPATPSADAALVSIALHIETSEIDQSRARRGGGGSGSGSNISSSSSGGGGGSSGSGSGSGGALKRSRCLESLDDDDAYRAKKLAARTQRQRSESMDESSRLSSDRLSGEVRHKDDMWLTGIVIDHILRRLAQSYPDPNLHFMPSAFAAFDLPRRHHSGEWAVPPIDVQQNPVDLTRAARLSRGESLTIIVPYNINQLHWNLIRIVITGGDEVQGELQLFEPLGRPNRRCSSSSSSSSSSSAGASSDPPSAFAGFAGVQQPGGGPPPAVSRRSLPGSVLEWLDAVCPLSGGSIARPWFDACVTAITTQQQRTGFDCGVASLLYAEQCAQGVPCEEINQSTDQAEITRYRETLFEYLRVLRAVHTAETSTEVNI